MEFARADCGKLFNEPVVGENVIRSDSAESCSLNVVNIQYMLSRSDSEDEGQDLYWTRIALTSFGFLGVLFIVLYSFLGASGGDPSLGNWLSRYFGTLGVLCAMGFASFSGGGILGFLFGIPKSISDPNALGPDGSPETKAEEVRRYRSNTNLEEMSDWLTKIIVGAGLVGIKELTGYFEQTVRRLAHALGTVPFAIPIVSSTMIAFFVLGFLSVYLLTRLFLAGAFSRAEARMNEKTSSVANVDFTDLSPKEREWLKKVLNAYAKKESLTLDPSFVRESEDHTALRSLKQRLIIQVQDGGSFRPGRRIIPTPLAERLMEPLKVAVTEHQH